VKFNLWINDEVLVEDILIKLLKISKDKVTLDITTVPKQAEVQEPKHGDESS
jgi:hypothetical protein